MPEYLSAVEAASVLGCSETLIRARIRTGELAASKHKGKWRILRADLDQQDRPHQTDSNRIVEHDRIGSSNHTESNHRVEPVRTESNTAWRDDLLAQVARLEASEATLHEEAARRESDLRSEMVRRETAAGEREERSKARIIDLERELTVRDSRIADLVEQNQILEAKVREILESGKDEALQLANRIADLVAAHEDIQTRVVELQPVAEKVPMLQAAVEERDATLSEQQSALQKSEEKLNAIQEDIDAIASRPVTGPVFRMLTKRKLRR